MEKKRKRYSRVHHVDKYAPDPTVDTPPTSPLSENRDVFVDDIPTTEQAQEQETKNDGEKNKGEKRKGKAPMNLKL
ncbi:hypothetical protein Tco_0757509 [Tanacetum coccineum]